MKVLIVDDEALVRRSLGRACRARHHEVFEAIDGREGLDLWLKNDPDVVFLDILMPALSGPEVLQELLRKTGHRPKARVVLMSAYSGEHNLETAQQMGADVFIPKPFDDIFSVIEKAENIEKRDEVERNG